MAEYPHDLQRDVEIFLYHEAKLLDAYRFEEWLALFTDDARYWMPIAETLEDGEEQAPVAGEWAMIEDSKGFLVKRYERLNTGLAHSERPRSRTRRFVSNVLARPEGEGAVIAESNLLLFQSRRDKSESFFVGHREDRLVQMASGWKIAERRVYLDHRVMPRALSIFL